MNKRQLLAAALGASLLVSALPGLAFAQDEDMTYAAEDVQWVLSELAGQPVPEAVEVTLLLSGGQANGNAGCNTYFGSYEIDAETLTFPGPFGVTQMMCEGAPMDTEGAYLPLLETTAGWSVDEAGMLSLTDADGAVTLVYGELPVDITMTDLELLAAELASLQTQIDEASVAVAALAEEAASVNVNKITKRIATNEDDIAALQKKTNGLNVDKLKSRISTNEKGIAKLNDQVANLKKRVNTLEKSDKDQEERIAALEELVPEAVPLPE